MTPDTGIAEVEVSAYEIPTAVPESDGTRPLVNVTIAPLVAA